MATFNSNYGRKDSYIQLTVNPRAYNISSNSTVVDWSLRVYTGTTYWQGSVQTSNLYINGGSSLWSASTSNTYAVRTWYTLGSGSKTIPHNSDGTKTITLKAAFAVEAGGAGIGSVSINTSMTLPTIPRTSSFTIPSSFNVGSAFTVSISRASSSFTHWVELWDGSTRLYSSGNTVGTSVSPNINVDTLVGRISGVKSKTFTLKVTTYNGNTSIGSASKNITAYIPAGTFTIPSSFNVGSAFTASINRVGSLLTYRIQLVDGSTEFYLTDATSSASLSTNVPANTLLARMSGVKSKTFTVHLHTYNNGTWIAYSSKTITANIPISTFTAPTSFTMGNAFTVSISRVGSLTHEIALHDGSTALYWSGNVVSDSGSVNVALSTLAARSPNSMSRAFTLRVYTYNGGTHIGSTAKSITAYVPSTVKPTFSAVTVSENVSTVASLVGAYVQTKSRLNLAITGASGIYGSTIRSYNITGVGHNVNSSSTVTGLLSVSGNQKIKGTVTDSRGQTFSKEIEVNILPYTPPTLSNLSFRRTLDDKTEAPLGDYVTVRANVEVQSLTVNGVEKNSIKYQVQSAQSGSSFADKENTTSTDLTKSYSDVWVGYSVDHSYNFRVRAGDVFGFSGWSVGVVPTGVVTQQWGSKTTSFGKMIDNTSYNIQVGTGGIQSDGGYFKKDGRELFRGTDISWRSDDRVWNTAESGVYYTASVGVSLGYPDDWMNIWHSLNGTTAYQIGIGSSGNAWTRRFNKTHGMEWTRVNPNSHTHSWSQVTGKPPLFDNATHLGTSNLNNITTPGVYFQNANANATTARNYPVSLAGSLIVTTSAGITQVYTTYGSTGRTFTRGQYSGTWYSWQETQRVEDTGWHNIQLLNGFTAYSTGGTPKYRIKNGMIEVSGAVKPPSGNTVGTSGGQVFGKIPHSPSHYGFVGLMHGSGTNVWLLRWEPDGSLRAERYRDENGTMTNPTTGHWLPFQFVSIL